MISVQQRVELKEIIAIMMINPNDSLSEDLLVQEYSAARQFVHSCIVTNSSAKYDIDHYEDLQKKYNYNYRAGGKIRRQLSVRY